MGKIHSIETMGLVDGPGIRFVVFFQGCYLRCLYCHNPDTWPLREGQEISAQELLEKALRYKPFFQKSGGGVTCSGGEPLLQPDFLIEFLKLCKDNDIHTALDTSGFGVGKYEEILEYTDLVILDVKHYNQEDHKMLTGWGMKELWKFKEALDLKGTKLWIRHVVIPDLTDSREHIENLKAFISQFKNVEKVELLPYHNLAIEKYRRLGLEYKLAGTKPMDKEKLVSLEKILKGQ
ncbi:MAG: pyruvate formate lyase-activating protein [Clostridia bacterium]|jgi:pyruvate formate lyase activating enzyme|nr:pyruvate formate lyase-activating protein [Clostridia bacterium]